MWGVELASVIALLWRAAGRPFNLFERFQLFTGYQVLPTVRRANSPLLAELAHAAGA